MKSACGMTRRIPQSRQGVSRSDGLPPSSMVIAGLDPAIQSTFEKSRCCQRYLDRRVKPGDDDRGGTRRRPSVRGDVGLAQHGRLQFRLLEPVLHDVADADDAGELAAV